MVTKVGLQSDFISALRDLAELDFDAIEAYDAALSRLNNAIYRAKLTEFRDDHINHTININNFLIQHHQKTVDGPSVKQWITKGKVIFADLVGDRAILTAMVSNEIDTNTAYERLNNHADIHFDAIKMLKDGLKDERKHKTWLEQCLAYEPTERQSIKEELDLVEESSRESFPASDAPSRY